MAAGADAGAGRLRAGADAALRKAPYRSGGGEEAPGLAGRGEAFRCSLVHDQDPTAWPYRCASVPQGYGRPRETVQALDEEHQVMAR